ncbi:MAG: translocation/assembly module TamB domain-containing protein [Prevotellaceae bacterium]|jgi:hypothetical protein|nr:translocation/assembly module TamB domain-containing protein [Prevotellaceae bacterium]
MKKRRKWLKWVVWLLLSPVILFLILMALLYVPPVQNLLRQRVTTFASEATGMDIQIARIDLRFPLNLLVSGVQVVQQPDTLLALESLNIHLQAMPLLNGRIEIDDITLRNTSLHSARLIDGFSIKGNVGRFSLRSHGIDLENETVSLDNIELADSRLSVVMTDTTTTPDTVASPSLRWQARLHTLSVKNFAVDIQLPADSLTMNARIGELRLHEATADLGQHRYGWQQFLLSGTSVDYPPFALREIRLGVDSVRLQETQLSAVLRECALYERSGMSITSLTGSVIADTDAVRIPRLQLLTPHSELNLSARTDMKLNMDARFDARIGRQDVLLFLTTLPTAFREAYPVRPLTMHAAVSGNLKQLDLTRLTAELPGVLSLDGNGTMTDLTDTLARSGALELKLQTQDIDFLTTLADSVTRASFAVPDSMQLYTRLGVRGKRLAADMKLTLPPDSTLHADSINLHARYDMATQAYNAGLAVHALQMHRFLPLDSIYTLTAGVVARGQGFDLKSPHLTADIRASLNELHYGRRHLSAVKLEASARSDSTKVTLTAGDLLLRFRARSSLNALMEGGTTFAALLRDQIERRYIDHAALRRSLPSAALMMRAGQHNPLSDYLREQGIGYRDFTLLFALSPRRGINGRTALHGLRMDSLQLDTLFFAIRQDTARMTLQGGVVNAPGNPQYVFRSTLTGELRNNDADLLVSFLDEHGQTGLNLGINARPVVNGGRRQRANGVAFKLIPEEPIVAFRKFHFTDNKNRIYLNDNMRVYANVEMTDEEEMGFRLQSVAADTVSLQNMDVELQRFRLDEISRIVPYMPRLTGLLSAEANYVQKEHSLQVSAEANISRLTYEGQPVGNLGAGATWLPGETGMHYLNAYFTTEGNQVINADAVLKQQGGRDSIDVTTTFDHFPMTLANSFIPGQVATLSGDIDGEVNITGNMSNPKMLGQLSLDSVAVYARQAGTHYHFDNRPVRIEDNRIRFDKFAIYTTGANPFTIDGHIDFGNLRQPTANLSLEAKNYTLLDARRTRESLIYGQMYVDLRATVRGALDALTMRGSMSLLPNTDVTYVLDNSPLTVEDRLGDLVTFVSFDDTTTVQHAADAPTMSLGGMNMLMSLNIAESVRLRADLSADRSSRVELEGGGTLNLQYTPQGDLTLSGRYTLIGGMMKYQLPVIPLKEFQFVGGSYVDWTGNPMNPTLSLKATERVRASVSDDDNNSRMVNFDVSVSIRNRLESPELTFGLDAPEDAAVQNELATMGSDERSKQAVAMLATGLYLKSGMKGGGLNMGSALNAVLTSQINAIAGSSNKVSLNVGVEESNSAETGDKTTNYSFRYSQRFFNDRVQVIIGGKVSTGANATNSVESFIDNVSLEYRLDASGTRYVRAFHNKNYESVLDGEITETGVGLVLRRKVNRLGELFIFRRKKEPDTPPNEEQRNKAITNPNNT